MISCYIQNIIYIFQKYDSFDDSIYLDDEEELEDELELDFLLFSER